MSTNIEGSVRTTASPFTRGRIAFRNFRWQRPFWAGLFTMIAAAPIAWFPYRGVSFGDLTIRMATTAGAGSLVIAGLLAVLGLTIWFQPQVRIFAGVAAILLALVSLIVSNFGGFLMGFFLALIGGAMSVAWAPGDGGAGAAGTYGTTAAGTAQGGERPAHGPETTAPLPAAADAEAPGPAGDPGKGKHRAQ